MGTRVATIVGSSVRKPSVEKIVASGVGVRVIGSVVSGRVEGYELLHLFLRKLLPLHLQ